jgi:hypothetical protein
MCQSLTIPYKQTLYNEPYIESYKLTLCLVSYLRVPTGSLYVHAIYVPYILHL